jgi:DNA helicase-2/ATP-dependent DNA helicase PcrA
MNEFLPTDEQRAIIEYPLVPLRVVAGAGTGKTTTIVERLAQGVRHGGDPTRALGITFTNKAADELRVRLRAALGDRPDAREVEVATYHSFAASILDEFGAFVGYRPTTALMDEGHRCELAYRVLRDLDVTDLDLAALSSRKGELLAIADTMTANLLNADDIVAIAPREPDDVWRKRIALARAAEHYVSAKRELGFLEFGDLIRLAVEIVEDFGDIATQLAARYDTVLLDEYQDTDPAQRRLLAGIFSDDVAVTAVGDADQTIYEWRGASLENFTNFPQHFRRSDGLATETLPLSINRRSDRIILDMANLIQSLLPRIEASKPLTAHDSAADGELEVGWFATDDDETAWIAEEIVARRDSGIAWSDIAILCRKRSTVPAIVRALRHAEVPYSVNSMGELLTVSEVADLLAWIRVLADPADEPSLLRIWMGGMFRLGMRDISRLVRWCGDIEGRDLAVALEHLDDIEGLTPRGRERLERFASLHRELHARSQMLTVPRTLSMTIDRLGIWDEVAAQPPAAAITARVNIGRFTSLAHRWIPLDGKPTLAAFLRYVGALEDATPGEELQAAGDLSDDAVQVITAHTAKGLEWPVVFLPGLAKGTFPAGVRTYDDPDTSPLSLPYSLRLDRESFTEADEATTESDRKAVLKSRHDDAEWRLAYVAVTRAKHQLILTGHAWDQNVRNPREPSPLLAMAAQLEGSSTVTWCADPGTKPVPSPQEDASDAPDPLFTSGWAAALRSRLGDRRWIIDTFPDMVDAVNDRSEQLVMKIGNLQVPETATDEPDFATSVTNLVALAECPLKFKWIHHDRLPRRPRRSAARGTEFHRRIELHNLGVVALDDPSLDAYDAVVTDADADQDTRHSRGDPWETFAMSRFHETRAPYAEVPFVLSLDGGTVRGKIDAIYVQHDDSWEIVDYKSGERRDDDARNVQLQAYALAVAEGVVGGIVPNDIAVTFAYFGGDTPQEVTSQVDDAWLDEARTSVSHLVEVARDGPFEPRPSPSCRWCDFLHLCPAGRAGLESR